MRCLVAGGQEGTMAPSNIVEIVGFSEILMLRRNIFGLLLFVKISSETYRKIFEFGPSYSTGATPLGMIENGPKAVHYTLFSSYLIPYY